MNGNETITPAMLEALRQTKPWARFMSIVGFVSIGLMLLLAVIVAVAAAVMDLGSAAGTLIFILPALYVVMAVIYLFPTIYLSRYASAIGDAVTLPSKSEAVERALTLQKSFWKFVGILALVMLLIYIPGMILAAMGFRTF